MFRVKSPTIPITSYSAGRIKSFNSFHYAVRLILMPLGLQGAPATFQRMTNNSLGSCTSYAAAYLNDVVIHSTIRHLTNVLQKLREVRLTIRPKKCQFVMDRCSYLGHVVGNGEVRPEETNVQAV